jgi:hypothetical protein
MCAQVLKKELTAPGYAYDSGLRDQNAFVYALKMGWKEHSSHVLLINKQYCLNCYWKDLLQSGDLSSNDKKVSQSPPCIDVTMQSWAIRTREHMPCSLHMPF